MSTVPQIDPRKVRQKNMQIARSLIPLIDHTSLTGKETPHDIKKLCDEARGDGIEESAAAICIFPQHLTQARQELFDSAIRLATVVNFPKGGRDARKVRAEINAAIKEGAQEIDLVTPYAHYHSKVVVNDIWKACLDVCAKSNGIVTKLILETGAWENAQALQEHAEEALEAGFDFLKTSTGKFMVPDGTGNKKVSGATPEAVNLFIMARANTKRWESGIKISGGVRDLEGASAYLEQMARANIHLEPRFVRFGSSSLLPHLRAMLKAPNNV